MKTNYIIYYKTANYLRGIHKFHEYSDTKKVYVALVQNPAIKSAKIYKIEKGHKKLVEKFTKRIIIQWKKSNYVINY